MPLTNITTTLVNGVQEVTTAQNVISNASAVKESLLFRSGAALRASASGVTVLFEDCNVTVDSSAATTIGGSTTSATLSYSGQSNNQSPANQAFQVVRTSIFHVKPPNARHDYFISRLENSSIIAKQLPGTLGPDNGLFVYTNPGATLNDVIFIGTNAWEIVGAPSQAFQVKVRDCNNGYLNWQAGRLDFYYYSATNCLVDAWHNSGPNHHWNNVLFSTQKIFLGGGTGGLPNGNTLNYREGYTVSWRFLNPNLTPAIGVTLILRDDFATAGSVVEVGRWTTNAQGRLSGTRDSRTRTTGTDQERAALFLQTGHGFSNSSGLLRAVQPRIEIRSYSHQPVAGFGPSDTFSISAPIGSVNALGVAEIFEPFVLTLDARVTATQSAALAYTDLDTPDKFYNRIKAEWATVDGRPAPSASGEDILLGAVNLVIDATAASAYNFASNTITVKASAINGAGRIITTGTITFANGAVQGTTMLQGSNYTTPAIASGSVSNIVPGSRLQVFNVTKGTEVFNGIIAGTTYTNTYVDGTTFASGDLVRIRLAYQSGLTAKEFVEAEALAFGTGWSYRANQVDDAVYIANGINGSLVTGITITDSIDRMIINIAGGSVSWPQIYAYNVFWLFTAAGIVDDGAIITAKDTANYTVAGFKIRNSSTVPLSITSGYGVDAATGSVASLIDVAGSVGNIYQTPDVVIAYATGSGLSPAESAQLFSLNTGAVNIESINGAEVIGNGSEANPWRGVGVSP